MSGHHRAVNAGAPGREARPGPEPGTTALVVFVPGADTVCALARRIAPMSGPQMRAHITLLYPFMPSAAVSSSSHQMRALARAHLPIALTFAKTGRFTSGVLWLDPDSVALTDLVAVARARWPDWPPYGDPQFVVVPHLSLARSDDARVLDRVATEVAHALPLRATI